MIHGGSDVGKREPDQRVLSGVSIGNVDRKTSELRRLGGTLPSSANIYRVWRRPNFLRWGRALKSKNYADRLRGVDRMPFTTELAMATPTTSAAATAPASAASPPNEKDGEDDAAFGAGAALTAGVFFT